MAPSPSGLQIVRFGVFEVDRSASQLLKRGRPVKLAPQPIKVLLLLLDRHGQVVSRAEIQRHVWGESTFVDFERGINFSINQIRAALGDDAEKPRYIETLPKLGYRFVAEVTHGAGTEPVAHGAQSVALESDLSHLSRHETERPNLQLVPVRGELQPRPTPAARSAPEAQPASGWAMRLLWGTLILVATGGAWMFAWHEHGSLVLPPMTIRPLVTLPGMHGVPSFSPDGARITFAWKPPQGSSRIVVKLVNDEPVQELTRTSGSAHDDSPAWSPDGRSIAFARNSSTSGNDRDADGRSGIYVIPAIGGHERQVYSGQVCPLGGPTWAPDGRALVFAAIRSPTEHCDLYRLSVDTLAIARLISPETSDLRRADVGAGEYAPAFSPDGRTIAFIHLVGDYAQDLYVIPSQGGAPKRLTFDNGAIWGAVAWTPDALAILFESSRGGSPELWRVAASGGQPERLSAGGNATGGLAVDREGRRLAYVVRSVRCHISAFDVLNAGEHPVRIVESTRSEFSPSFSLDGRHIAFASNRAGDAYDIWVADADGTNQTRLTSSSRGENGSPRWSPDNKWLAYDSDASGDRQFDIHVVRADGRQSRRLTFDRSNEYGPSWSRDGRWVYFASDRTGKDQIYKMPTAGGVAVQITTGGGFQGAESADSRFLYYSKGQRQAGVWRVPVDGGLEEPVIPAYPAAPYCRYWTLVEDGIYFLNTQNETRPSVDFLRFATDRAERVLELPSLPGLRWTAGLAVSPNRRSLLTGFYDPGGSEIFVVENFR